MMFVKSGTNADAYPANKDALETPDSNADVYPDKDSAFVGWVL